jgi:hypothetical protein
MVIKGNVIIKDGESYEIIDQVNASMFQNKDGNINQQVLGMYVHNLGCERVVQRDNKLLILKLVEEAVIVE